MAVTTQSLFVFYRLAERLTKSNADILDSVMRINMKITLSNNI